MGVKYLASKLRESSITPDKLAECELLYGKTIGIDLFVILHKALGTNDGAGKYMGCTTCQQPKVNTAKVTLADLTKYNLDLVVGHESDTTTFQKYLRHTCLHVMMKEGLISRNNSLWNYLDHFASHCDEQIQRLRAIVEDKDQLECSQTKSYDTNFLKGNFSDYVE